MFNAQTAGHGSDLHNKLARFEDKSFRTKRWSELLIDNKDGQIVNSTSGALHYDDHKRMLDDVVLARKYMPTAFDALRGAPGVGVNVSLYETLVGYSNMNEFSAQTSMNGSNRKSNQTDYKYNWVPQPIYHCDFKVPWRQGGYAYKQSDGTQEAVMQVALERDQTIILGNSDIVVNVNGVDAPLYGLTNHPATLSQPGTLTDWADPANSDTVYKEANDMVASAFSQRKAGQIANSMIMFVANDIYPQLNLDYSTQKSGLTNLQRIEAIPQIRSVVPCQWLPDGAVLLVEAMPQTLRIPTSTDITVAPWTRSHAMEDIQFTVFAASTIQVREDRNGLTGIVYATKA